MTDYIPNLRDDRVDNTGKPFVAVEIGKDGEVIAGLREDGLVSMYFDIEDDLWIEIAKEAHKKDITINEYVVTLLENYANSILEESGD